MSRVEEAKRYRLKHLEEIRAKDRERYHNGLDTFKARQAEYRAKNREKERLRAAKYREENRDKIRLKAKEYRIKNKDAISAKDGARKARNRAKKGKIHLQFKDEISLIYAKRDPGQQVDHIIPINGENITGLHVPWNLQILNAAENNSKNNSVDLEEESNRLLSYLADINLPSGSTN